MNQEMNQTAPGFQVNNEMIRKSKTLTCECGGMLFKEALFFKILSPLISPSGKEELAPLQIFVCEKCGKVPSIFDRLNIVPDELKAKKPIN
ncbi:MAG: hypothetical protein PHF86_02435 [Candidatus Nanoarchaeia archaeon]|jgi:hypothetical protein|nr:hypothetical protein [Candidatus Nanoarchaeia archaeon]